MEMEQTSIAAPLSFQCSFKPTGCSSFLLFPWLCDLLAGQLFCPWPLTAVWPLISWGRGTLEGCTQSECKQWVVLSGGSMSESYRQLLTAASSAPQPGTDVLLFPGSKMGVTGSVARTDGLGSLLLTFLVPR